MQAHLRLRRITQTIADLSGKPWHELRVLDLGSLEGLFAMEFASRGAKVVAIEGRAVNHEKARFAAEQKGLRDIEFVTEDVRNFSKERFGVFDVVVCSGLLYHLPGTDACRFVHAIADSCTRLTIIDLHLGLKREVSIQYGGATYHGVFYAEHGESDSVEQKEARVWASLDNTTSFWFTRPSLLNLLRDAGFSSVFEILRPMSFWDYSDRFTFAGIKGEFQDPPNWNGAAETDIPGGLFDSHRPLHKFSKQTT